MQTVVWITPELVCITAVNEETALSAKPSHESRDRQQSQHHAILAGAE